MNIFKSEINKFFLVGLFIFGFSGNVIADEIFVSVESKAYKSYYSNQDYHRLKGEYNLDFPVTSYGILKDYRAEAFVSKHIYEIDSVRDIGEEFNFGKNNIAKLIKYTYDVESGFEAALYQINNGRLIIAFGGTTSKEKYSSAGKTLLNDVLTDLLLLSNVATNGQIYKAIIFTQNVQLGFPGQIITVTGHSLGGGLAQIASLASKNYVNYKKIKAITFNTAPIPITRITKQWIEDFDIQKQWSDDNNINFMTNKDELTNILKSVENYTGNNLKFLDIDTGHEALNLFLNYDVIYGKKLKAQLLSQLEVFLQIKANTINELIYGQRILLNTGTNHPMLSLLNATFDNIEDYSLFRKMFADISANTPLYDAVFNLIKNHSISYPKVSREYKFYPDENVTPAEVAIFIVNSMLYDEYRVEYAKDTTLTRVQFLLNNSDAYKKIKNNIIVRVSDLQKVFRELFISYTNRYIEEYRKSHLTRTLQITKIKKDLLMGVDRYGIGIAQINNLELYPESLVTRANIANKVFGTSRQVSNWKELTNKSCENYSNSFSENLSDGLKLVYKSLIQKAK